ncbi:MAG: hypothetical protein ACKVWV_14440 [Planctomycetota bacterium]
MHVRYRCKVRWSSDRPEVLVICCSDGRWHAQVAEFVREEVSDRPDLYAVPGGPVAVDPWASSFEEARVLEEALRLFVTYHALNQVWLVAHEGCAYYRHRHPHWTEEELRRRQEDDLRHAQLILQQRYPQLAVRLVYASHDEESVLFTSLDASGMPLDRRGDVDADVHTRHLRGEPRE